MTNHYEALGLTPQASSLEIKKAYRQLALRYHPDKNNSLEAPNRFREVAAAWQVLSDEERKARYDGSGGSDEGVDAKDREDVDPEGVFAEAFQGYSVSEAFDEALLGELQAKLWDGCRVSVTSRVLKLTDRVVRVSCTSRRLVWYRAVGFCLLAGGGYRMVAPERVLLSLFPENSDRRFMGAVMVGLGVGITVFGAQRPVVHIDLKAGRIFAGNLFLWHKDKFPDKVPSRETDLTFKRFLGDFHPRGRLHLVMENKKKAQGLPVATALLCLVNWLDYSNSMEQWKQYASIVGCGIAAMVPLVDLVERKCKQCGSGVFGLSAVLQGLGFGAIFLLTQQGSLWVRSATVDGQGGVPNVECYFHRRRPSPFWPKLPPQCKASEFSVFARTS